MRELIRHILRENNKKLFEREEYWTYEKTKEFSKNFNTRSALKKASQSAYDKARTQGWLDEFYPAKSEEEKINDYYEKAKKESSQFKGRLDFYKSYPNLYNISREQGWLDEFFPEKILPSLSNTREFINKSIKVHGDKYKYNKVNYERANRKVIVTCPEHGEFPITPDNHLRGRGCPDCANKRRSQIQKSKTEDFIAKAKLIHGDVYDYSNVNYINNREKVNIICKKHGVFPKSPGNHLKGQGCPSCTAESNFRGSSQRLSKEQFLQKSISIHGNKYDYSLVDYKNNHEDLMIICPKHGVFPQSAYSHFSGSGCPKCAGKNKTSDEFIQQAKEIHGNKFDYSNVDYVDATTKVKISCPKHGEFTPTPNQHLGGSGCPSCNESRGERFIDNLLSQNKIEKIRQKKFLDCTNKPKKGMQCVSLPFDFYLPKLNTIIEFDGQQHYKPVWGEDNLKKLQRLDKIRNEYCNKNGIKLIRIPYTMSPEEIETYLLMELGLTD